NATHVENRELTGAHYRENSHGFRCAVNPCTPSLTEQQQDGRNQRTRVTNTYPPYEVGDVPSPTNGAVNTPGSYTPVYFPYYGKYTETQEQQGKDKSHVPKP